MSCVPSFSKRSMTCFSASSRSLLVGDPVGEVDRRRAHAVAADHLRGAPGDHAEVAADAGRRLVVEDVLGGHRAEAPDQVADLLGAPVAEAVLDLHRLVVAAGGAALADRQPRRDAVLHVDVAADGVPGLVDRGRALLVLRVRLADRDAGLDGRHRLEQVARG